MDQAFDVFIAFHAVATVPINTIANDEAALVQAQILEINWSSYSVEKKEVDLDVQRFIQIEGPFVEEVAQQARISQEKMFEAVPLVDALKELIESTNKYKANNQNVCLVTFGHELLNLLLPKEAKLKNFTIASEFLTFFDILEEFKSLYTQFNFTFDSPNDVLRKLNLKIVEEDTLCLTECKSLIRILNILVRNKHKFCNLKTVVLPPPSPERISKPKTIMDALLQDDLDQIQLQIVSPKKDVSYQAASKPTLSMQLSRLPPKIITNSRSKETQPWKSFIRGRSPEPYKDAHRSYFIKMKGLPYTCSLSKVKEYLRGIRLDNENLCYNYDSSGKFTGEVNVMLYNYDDFKLALSFSHGEMGSRYIEIFESNEVEFKRARDSEKPDVVLATSESELMDLEGQNGVVRLRGLPFSATEKDIELFMKDCKIKEIRKLKRPIGRLCGECFVVLENKEDISKALAMNMEKIGHRFIEVFVSNLKELEHQVNTVTGSDNLDMLFFEHNIPLERKSSAISVVGIPFQAQKSELRRFFDGFNLKEEDILYFTDSMRKFLGKAIVIFESDEVARRALRERQKSYLGNRYLDLGELN